MKSRDLQVAAIKSCHSPWRLADELKDVLTAGVVFPFVWSTPASLQFCETRMNISSVANLKCVVLEESARSLCCLSWVSALLCLVPLTG